MRSPSAPCRARRLSDGHPAERWSDRRTVARAGLCPSHGARRGVLLVRRRSDGKARKMKIPDGRPRLPPGQSPVRPKGGDRWAAHDGDLSRDEVQAEGARRLRQPVRDEGAGLLAMPPTNQKATCTAMTKCSLLDSNGRACASRTSRAKAKPPSSRTTALEAAGGPPRTSNCAKR